MKTCKSLSIRETTDYDSAIRSTSLTSSCRLPAALLERFQTMPMRSTEACWATDSMSSEWSIAPLVGRRPTSHASSPGACYRANVRGVVCPSWLEAANLPKLCILQAANELDSDISLTTDEHTDPADTRTRVLLPNIRSLHFSQPSSLSTALGRSRSCLVPR